MPTTQRKILVIEDDLAIRRGVVDTLRYHSYEVLEAGDGVLGTQLAAEPGVDLVLLDLVLPRRDGLEVLRRIRQRSPTLPVIIVTARGDESQRIDGLQRGADDYVVKPFSARELVARVEAVLRRSAERPPLLSRLTLGHCEVDLDRHQIRFQDDTTTTLTPLESEVLRYLGERATRTISREELLERVWQSRSDGLGTRCVDMTVARLRKKLRSPDGEGSLVTVRGRGYRFDP